MIFFKYIGYIIFLPIWWIERLIPRNKKVWIFGAWYGQKYSDNSKWLYEYVLQHHSEIQAIWITKNEQVYNDLKKKQKPVFMSSSFTGMWWCIRAGFAFLTSGVVDVNKMFLNGCKQIWLWHGMPLKKIGYSDDTFQFTPFQQKIRQILNPYSLMRPYCTLTSDDYFTPFLMEAFKLSDDRVWKTGLPRCDAFFSTQKDKFVDQLRQKFVGSKILLYMPTFRMSSTLTGELFSAFVEKFGFNENEFTDFLNQQNVVFLFKPHFIDNRVDVKINSQRFIYLKDNDYDDLYIMLNNVDALITDYSSVYFDFLAANKPIYLFPFDYTEYITKSRSHYFDMYKEMDGIVCNNWKEFYKAIDMKTNDKQNISHKFSHYLDGTSCQKVVEYVKKG